MRVCIVGASGKAWAVHGPAVAGSRLRGGWRVPRAKRGEARRVQGAHHCHTGSDRRPRGHQACCNGMRRGSRRDYPRGVHGYSTGTTQAVLDYAPPGARLIFSCGWHITLDGQDVYSLKLKTLVKVFGPLGVSLASPISTTRWRQPGGSSPATRGGPSCAEATLRRARVRACPCGAGTWVIPFSRATPRAASTSPFSSWRLSPTTNWFTRHPRLWAAGRPRRSRTPPSLASEPFFPVYPARGRGGCLHADLVPELGPPARLGDAWGLPLAEGEPPPLANPPRQRRPPARARPAARVLRRRLALLHERAFSRSRNC